MGNHQDATIGFLLVAIDALRHDAQSVNVQAGVSLVHDCELRLQDIQLHDLMALLLAAGEAFVDGAGDEGLINLQVLAGLGKLLVPFAQLRCLAANGGDCGAHELGDLYAWYLSWVLHRQEEAGASALVDGHLQQIFAVEKHLALGDLILWVAGDGVGQGGLAGTVRAHDGVDLAGVDGQVNALEDFLRLAAFFRRQHLGVEVLNFQSRHNVCGFPSMKDLGGDLFQFFGNAVFQFLGQGLHRNTVDDLIEEATDDEAAGFSLWNTARHQVEQLDVIEATNGGRVACTGNFTGLNLQVRDCVRASTLSQNQVVVGLVGIGALCIRTDKDIAHPAGAGLIVLGALQCALIKDVGAAIRDGVIHQHAVFKVLAFISEVDAQQLCVAALLGEVHARHDAYHLAAKDGGVVAQHGIAAELCHVVRQVYGIVFPINVNNDGQVSAIAHDELDVICVGARADVLQDDGGFRVVAYLDGGGAKGSYALALAGVGNDHGLFHLSLGVNSDNLAFRHRGPRLCRNAVRRGTNAAQALVIASDGLGAYAWMFAHGDILCHCLSELAIVQSTELAQGDKAPHLIAAVRHREVLHVGGGKDVTLGDLIRIEFVRSDHFL